MKKNSFHPIFILLFVIVAISGAIYLLNRYSIRQRPSMIQSAPILEVNEAFVTEQPKVLPEEKPAPVEKPAADRPVPGVVQAVKHATLTPNGEGSYLLRSNSAEWDSGLVILPKPGESSLDLSNAYALAMDIKNLSDDRQMRLTLHISSGGQDSDSESHATAILAKNRALNTGIGLNPGEKRTLRILLPHPELYISPDGLPSRYVIDTEHINKVELKVQWPYENQFQWVINAEVSNIRLEGAPKTEEKVPAKFTPFIDQYGQFVHREWPEKVHSDEELAADLVKERAALKSAPASWDEFGGWKNGPQLQATGFFRTEKVDGKWWFVTPSGHLFFSLGFDCTRASMDSSDGARHPDWYVTPVTGSYMSMNFHGWNLQKKFGKEDYQQDYDNFVLDRFDSWGINTIGNWSDRSIMLNGRKPYVASVFEMDKSIPTVARRFYDCYDPNYLTALEKAVFAKFEKEAFLKKSINDPMCIGYFIDNERRFEAQLLIAALKSKFEECAAKREFLSRCYRKYKTIEAFNAAWETSFANWEALKTDLTEIPRTKSAGEDVTAFLYDWYCRYFSSCRNVLKKIAPNHLYLGSRFIGFRQSPTAWKAAAQYCDVITVNSYANSFFNLPKEIIQPDAPEKPLLIGEFHFGTLDRGMFKASLCPLETQADRAHAFTRAVQGALCHPLLIGAHWFQYRDQPLIGRGDGEAYQIGFVDVVDRPYQELCDAAREVGENMYEYRVRGKLTNEMR